MTRIIAGRAKGRKLATPPGDATRPTADRVREAFFSALAAWNGSGDVAVDEQLAELSFLDLYAGSGAMGLEAASRGASRVVAVESDARTADVIRRNASEAKLPVQVRVAKAETFTATEPEARFDVVWLDPPYPVTSEHLEPMLERIREHWLVPNGVIVVERPSKRDLPEVPGTDSWTRAYGETTLVWYAPLDPVPEDNQPQEPA